MKFRFVFLIYLSIGKKDVGPTKQNPATMNILPMHDDIFGFINLSTNKPQNGAAKAYIPPFITKIIPEILCQYTPGH